MSHDVVMLGFPATGKSTYLGALWALIEDAATDSVWEVDFEGDREYVQALSAAVVAAEPVSRTPVSTTEGLRATIGFASASKVDLAVTDPSGEQLRELVEERHWPGGLAELVRDADGLLVFLHPDDVRVPSAVALGDNDGDEIVPFQPRQAATAARLLDALENVLAQRAGCATPVVFVVSAFDLADGMKPREWLERRLPALVSFADARAEFVGWTVFGVSAQGGELPAGQDELLRKGDLRYRCFAVNAEGEETSLSEPLAWLARK